MGLGMASVYATGLLWLEGFTPVTSAMAATFTVAASLGPDLFPLLVGQFMETQPMFMMYCSFGVIVACVLIFAGAYYFGIKVRKERVEQEKENSKEEADKML